MPFDPTIPAVNADLDADPIRDNFNELKALIDAIPPPPTSLVSGQGVLDGGGVLVLSGLPAVNAIVVSWLNAPGSGVLFNNTFSSIQSSAGSADAGLAVNWIAF